MGLVHKVGGGWTLQEWSYRRFEGGSAGGPEMSFEVKSFSGAVRRDRFNIVNKNKRRKEP